MSRAFGNLAYNDTDRGRDGPETSWFLDAAVDADRPPNGVCSWRPD